MAVMRDLDIIWDDLQEAFENPSEDVVYFLDRDTGEVFFVPGEYQDDEFWTEVDGSPERYLQIPGFDYEQERLLIYEFMLALGDDSLKKLLERTFTGRPPFGKIYEILSFYPDEHEQLTALRDELTGERIRRWLEEHDIFFEAKEEF